MCGINDSQVILVVAICTSVIAGAVTAITTYKMDITNIAMPATDPTIFSDFMPRDATHMKKTNSASVSPYILEKFEKWAGYKFRPEFIVDQGYHNTMFRVPSKEFRDFIEFQQSFSTFHIGDQNINESTFDGALDRPSFFRTAGHAN